MFFDVNKKRLELIRMFGKYEVLFTNMRIKRDTVPKELHVYDIRHDDECQEIMWKLKPFVLINHWGTIISRFPIDMSDGSCRFIDEKEDCEYLNISMTLKEYMERKS